MKKNSTDAYGLLLTLDGYGASSKACSSESHLLEILNELPLLIGMRPLGEPHIVSVTEAGIAGLSGFRFIMESHISIHTYSERGFVTADIYSCKAFDTEVASSYLVHKFRIAKFKTQEVVRGDDFGKLENIESGPRTRP